MVPTILVFFGFGNKIRLYLTCRFHTFFLTGSQMELESGDLDKIKLSSWPSQFRVTLEFEEQPVKKKSRDRTKEKSKYKKEKKARAKTEQTEKS